MPLNIMLDEEQAENSGALQTIDENRNEIQEKLDKDSDLSDDIAKIRNNQMINMELAEEVLSVLREIENEQFEYSNQERYINTETDAVSYYWLRKAGESEPARLIKNKRRLDLAQWGRTVVRSTQGIERGAKLAFNNPEYFPDKYEKARLREWENRLINHAFYPANEQKPNFAKFIGSAYEDFFDLDDITLEVRTDGLNNPIALHLQDPIIWKPVIKSRRYNETVYNNDLTELFEDYKKLFDEPIFYERQEREPDYILVYQHQRLAGATFDKVRKHHFFTRTDFRKAQRGYSIVEQAIRMVTYITNALKMNASNFTNNRLPQGFFAFTGGGVGSLQLEKLKKIFYAYQNGAGNSSRFPMVSLKGDKSDVKWVGTRTNSREMEYHQFMTLLFSIFCQLSGTDPRELSLGSYGDAVGKSRLFDEPTDGVVKESKDLGAKTFLAHLEDSLNVTDSSGVNVFQKITGMDVRLKFVGFEVEDKQKKLEINTKEIATSKSINDLLAENDEEKQKFEIGGVNIYDVKALSNQQVFQSILFKAQQEAQQQQMGGMPGQGMPPDAQGEPAQPGQEQGEQELTPEDLALLQKHGATPEDINNELGQELGAEE